MSEAREFENPLIRPAANAVHALQGRVRSWLATSSDSQIRPSLAAEQRARATEAPGLNPVGTLAKGVVRIASIDLDYDPWWLYFRRRR